MGENKRWITTLVKGEVTKNMDDHTENMFVEGEEGCETVEGLEQRDCVNAAHEVRGRMSGERA